MNTFKNKSVKFLLLALISIIFIPLFSINANATPNVTQPNNGVSPIKTEYGSVTDSDISGDNQVPNVNIESAKDLVERKTYDIVTLMQIFAKPFSAIIFIACALISLFGAITRASYLGKGILGMFISGIMYTAIIYAPEIMNFFSTWLTSK